MITEVAKAAVSRPGIATDEDIQKLTASQEAVLIRMAEVDNKVAVMVPEGRTINGYALDKDVVLTPKDLDTLTSQQIKDLINASGGGSVPAITINGYTMDKDINLTAQDVGAYSTSQSDQQLAGKVPTSRRVNNKALTGDITLTAADVGAPTTEAFNAVKADYVPKSRKVNSKALTGDITLTAADIGSYTKTETDTALNTRVPTSRKVNNKALTSDITLTAADVGSYTKTETDTALNTRVPTSRKVNNKALTSDITLTAADVGAPTTAAFNAVKEDYVPKSRTINNQPLTGNITLTASSVGAVPNTFKINGQPMTGTEMTISGGGGGVTVEQVQGMLTEYIPVMNQSGLANEATKTITGKIAEEYHGGGFYSYDNTGGKVDAPAGSVKGDLILVGFDPDPEGNSQDDLVACPGLAIDRGGKGIAYRTVTADGKDGPWGWVYSTGNPPPTPDMSEYVKKTDMPQTIKRSAGTINHSVGVLNQTVTAKYGGFISGVNTFTTYNPWGKDSQNGVGVSRISSITIDQIVLDEKGEHVTMTPYIDTVKVNNDWQVQIRFFMDKKPASTVNKMTLADGGGNITIRITTDWMFTR